MCDHAEVKGRKAQLCFSILNYSKWFKWQSNDSQMVEYFKEMNKQPVEPKNACFLCLKNLATES